MSCPRCGLDCHGMANIYANQNERLMAEMTSIESERDALQARVKRLEEALEFGVGLNRSKELMSDNHIVGVTELVKRTKEVPCPDCYGGHFKPCNICGDSGVALLVIEQKESKP